MANVKISPIGLLDMLYFKNKPKKREKKILSSSDQLPQSEYQDNAKAAERHPDEQVFVVEDIVRESEDTKTFVLRRPYGKPAAPFRAGQYVVIRQKIDGKLIARPVSISSNPDDAYNGLYSITVKKVPDGFLSVYVFDNWKTGDEVRTSGPQGTFFYEGLRDSKNVVAAAGGSGITPILSMAKAIAAGTEDFNLTVLYGSRTAKDVLFRDKFTELCEKCSRIKIVYVLSDEFLTNYENGFVDAGLIRKYAPSDGDYSLFAAGPQMMYNFLDKEVEKLGLRRKFYRKEIFGSAKMPWTLPGYPVDKHGMVFNLHVKMCNKEYDIPCSADENMIVALERAGIAGPNRCRGGVCGWCRSRLVSGEVFVPENTDGRRAADKVWGYIHPCATFALGDCSIEIPNNK